MIPGGRQFCAAYCNYKQLRVIFPKQSKQLFVNIFWHVCKLVVHHHFWLLLLLYVTFSGCPNQEGIMYQPFISFYAFLIQKFPFNHFSRTSCLLVLPPYNPHWKDSSTRTLK
uniref:Ribonucleoside-diphosphate reductase small chain n=1 Tax=Rhizophora mucronata TaxID=61149 RepID=A0A2P2LGV0_RHIMU